MSTMLLPGLRGDDALGFLAAIGLLSLADQGLLSPLRLTWEGSATPVARVEGAYTDVRDLGAALVSVLDDLDEREGVIPGLEPDFPLPKRGSGSDPMRMSRAAMARFFAQADDARRTSGDPWFGRWLLALAAQGATKQGGDVELTPFYAPTGQMSLRGSVFEKTMEAVRDVDGPGDALTAWRRTAYDGANFDDRAKRDAGVTTSGKPGNQGAPSPTWLAAMGIRFFAVTDDGEHARTVGWQRIRMYPGFTSRSLVWPTWERLLDPPAVRTLLAHPALELAVDADRSPHLRGESATRLRGLGVTAVFGASRRTLQQGDGPLGPAHLVWLRDG